MLLNKGPKKFKIAEEMNFGFEDVTSWNNQYFMNSKVKTGKTN